MGPFPHDAPAATISADNPMGTDGFEFVEYAHPKPEELHALFKLMGYAPVARHKTRKITVYRQGDINYLVNEEPETHGHSFVAAHGPCAPSMAFRVVDAKQAYERALSLGSSADGSSGSQRSSSGFTWLGLPRKYSLRQPGLEMGLKVALATARLTRPPTTWYWRPSISAHCTQRG